MNEEQMLTKDMLEFVRAAGGTGVLKTRLLEAVRHADGSALTPEERDYLFGTLEKRGWVTSHMEPIWHNRRWTLTERGLTALEGM